MRAHLASRPEVTREKGLGFTSGGVDLLDGEAQGGHDGAKLQAVGLPRQQHEGVVGRVVRHLCQGHHRLLGEALLQHHPRQISGMSEKDACVEAGLLDAGLEFGSPPLQHRSTLCSILLIADNDVTQSSSGRIARPSHTIPLDHTKTGLQGKCMGGWVDNMGGGGKKGEGGVGGFDGQQLNLQCKQQ